jgi:uncharacterized protein
MRRDLTSVSLRFAAYVLPWVALMPFGAAWMFEHHGWIPFGLAAAAVTGFLLILSRWLAAAPQLASTPPPIATWPDAGQRAWPDVDALATRIEAAPPDLGDSIAYRDLFLQILDVVGRHFHPESKHPALELTVSKALEISERALRDLRSEIIDVLPVVNSIRLADVEWARRAAEHLPTAHAVAASTMLANRVRRLLFNPPVAIAYEIVNVFEASSEKLRTGQAARIAAGIFVRKVGTYAIQAFSGQASLDLTTLQAVATDAPLRILLLGPLNAGKSSLLNAMFGQQRSTSNVLPCPGVKGEHILDHDGGLRAVVLDSDGFGGAGDEAARRRLFETVESVDLIVAVTSARQAARKLECETLEEARRRFAASTRRVCPPIIVVATHIDELRPHREWSPPYNFLEGDSPKELSIREAIDVIARDFQISLDRVIPVCLAPHIEYNVEETLMPALGAALPEADRAKFLRLVETNRSAAASDLVAKRTDLLIKLLGHATGIT